jgi:hypothetical protein
MAAKLNSIGAGAVALVFLLCAQAQEQEPPSEPTLAERVAQLQRDVATLDTRLALRGTLDPGSAVDRGAAATAARVEQLEQALERLTAELQRVERQSDAALREAIQARREATAAQQIARDAASRLR